MDVIAELRRAKYDPHGRRRTITAWGRYAGIPAEWTVELTEAGFVHVAEPQKAAMASKVKRREEGEAERQCELRHAILGHLPLAAPGLTRAEIWAALPAAVKVNEVRFRSILEAECGKLWAKEESEGAGGGFRYWRCEEWVAKDG